VRGITGSRGASFISSAAVIYFTEKSISKSSALTTVMGLVRAFVYSKTNSLITAMQ
jgi:hypothetical protein